MKGYIVTSDECSPCAQLKEGFKELIEKGEIEEINFEKDPEKVMAFMEKYEADIPSVLIVANDGELILKM